jgi:hypothetical protein
MLPRAADLEIGDTAGLETCATSKLGCAAVAQTSESAVSRVYAAVGFVYIKAHPLVFNESFFQHAHCIKQADGMLEQYAITHGGRFPFHTNGYGDALLLLVADDPTCAMMLTGPGFDDRPFLRALKNGGHLPEAECGRVYVQGLSVSNDVEIAILFDKIPTPGGDHCHMLQRLKAPLGREVLTIGGGHGGYVPESEWPEYSRKQIELLVQAGMTRQHAKSLYASGSR